MASDWVAIGKLVKTIGLKGDVKLASQFDQLDQALPLWVGSEPGQTEMVPQQIRPIKGGMAIRFAGIMSVDAAQALVGLSVWAPRDALPMDDTEFLVSDLMGLEVREDDRTLGHVKEVGDFGGGDVLCVVDAAGVRVWIPFIEAVVPEVNLREGWLRVVEFEAYRIS